MMEGLFVSVIVPTYKDWRRLAQCLFALAQQTISYQQFEILIVNNEPADAMPEGFALPANARLLNEAKKGSYAARNTALQQARGAIIAFTDADCVPDKNWMANALQHFAAHPTCSRIAGPLHIFSTVARPSASAAYDAVYAFPQQQYVTNSNGGVTGNLWVRKTVFDAVGLFNEALLSNGDLEWGRAAHRAGFLIDYVPAVAVKHPARNLTELVQKARRVGGGRGMAERSWRNKTTNVLRLLNGFRPRLAEIKFVFAAAPQLRTRDKLKVILLRHYLLQIIMLERVRVQLGKAPTRT